MAVVEWLGPDNKLASTTKFPPLESGGPHCFDASLWSPDNRRTPAPGAWVVRLRWNGAIALSIPFTVEGPDALNCVSGLVDSVTTSLEDKTVGLASEVVIGGRVLCAECAVKPPVFPEFARTLDQARETKTLVDACYDSTGAVNRVRLKRALY